MNELLTVEQAATLLRRSASTIRRYIQSGKLNAVRVGRRVRVPREAVEALLVGDEVAGFREAARPAYRAKGKTKTRGESMARPGPPFDAEIIPRDQLEQGYAILDELVGFCESDRTDASINHDRIIYELKRN